MTGYPENPYGSRYGSMDDLMKTVKTCNKCWDKWFKEWNRN